MIESCEQLEPLLSAYLDDELDAPDRSRVEGHLAECAACSRELEELRGMVRASKELSAPAVDDEIWDAFLDNVYNRVERRLGWTLLLVGLVIVAAVLLYEAIVLPWATPAFKALFAVPLAGLFMLFISVLRQRLHVARSDRYSRDVRH